MADSYSAGKAALVEPGLGAYVDQWYSPLNSNFSVIDATVSGTTNIDVSSITSSNPYSILKFNKYDINTDTAPQEKKDAAQNLRIKVYGTLSFNVTIIVDSESLTTNIKRNGLWIVDNQTTGPFKVFIKTELDTSLPLEITQGYMSMVFSDGINFNYADAGTARSVIANHVTTGSIILYSLSTSPSALEYLVCDGAGVSRTTYANLFAKIGTTWGAGDGVNTFNVPNLPFGTPPATYMIKT